MKIKKYNKMHNGSETTFFWSDMFDFLLTPF